MNLKNDFEPIFFCVTLLIEKFKRVKLPPSSPSENKGSKNDVYMRKCK